MLTPLLRLSMGIRAKLIAIFVLIKIVPLLLLVVLLWYQLDHYSDNIDSQQAAIVNEMEQTISLVGSMAVDDAVMALDASARESIERLTNDTAHSVANFLYTRDADIRLAAILPQTETNFKNFLPLITKLLPIILHGGSVPIKRVGSLSTINMPMQQIRSVLP